ncbi:MAG: hypothetical protein H8E30_02945 [Alphaproteobacteria bacterium]|nr:hypothetical protein [Alphaproteobacteria bacterium]
MRWVSLMALLLLAACAREPVWSKPGGSAAIFEQDTTACFRGASIQAQDQAGGQGAAPQIELRSSLGKVHDATGASGKATSLRENALRSKLYSQCMHRLGYRRTEP